MAVRHIQQFTFDKGIVDPELLGRRDIRAYAGGCREATNLTGLIGGPMRVRGGTRYAAALPEADDGGGGVACLLAGFEFSTEELYLFAFTDEELRVYRDGALQATVATPWTGAQLAALDYDQSLDTMLAVHEETSPRQIQRQGSHTAWAVSEIAFRNVPTHPFDGPTEGTATPSHTSGAARTITSTEADFADAAAGDLVRINSGWLRITTVNSTTQVTGDIEETLDNTDPAEPGLWSVEEPVWSSARGWPRSVHLDDNRSYWGGSKSLPQRVWGSASGGVDLFDFMETKEALDDEYVEADLVGSRVNAIQHIVSLRDQFIFTTGGVFVNEVSSETGVTPESFRPRKQAPAPAAKIKPQISDDSVTAILADGEGNATVAGDVLFDLNKEGYIADDLNILSAGTVSNPVDFAARTSDGVRQANHRFVVNGDGSVGVHHSLRRQEVSGWTLWRSPGASGTDKVRRVAVIGNDPWFLVERTIGGARRLFIERHDPAAKFDCSVRATFETPTDTLTGLDHAEGETVKVFADGALRDDAVVTAGQISVTDGGEAFAATDIEAGFEFAWALEPLPVEGQLRTETLVGEKHRLAAATIEVREAFPFTVTGTSGGVGGAARQVSHRRFGAFTLDAGAQTFSGRTRKIRFLGWNRGQGAAPRIEGTLPATILSWVAEIAQ